MEKPDVRELIRAEGFRFDKSLGQNFVFDGNLLGAIAADAGVCAEDTVVEIGTGAGTLTAALAERAGRVISFEVDERLRDILSLSLRGRENVEVVFRDVLRMKDAEISEITGGKPFRVVANLPYCVTSPMIMRFVESALPVTGITVMVQKEVADRLCAAPATPDYAAVTLAVKIFGDAVVTRTVSRKMFLPPPNVDSAVVRIDRVAGRLAGENAALIKKLVRAGFAMRRKTLVNNLCAALSLPREKAEAAVVAAGFSPMVRGETLSLDGYVALSHAVERVTEGVI